MKHPVNKTMKKSSVWKLVIWLFVNLASGCIKCQRPSSSHRQDVYIAGFFPYGEGVENSETGRGVMPSVKLALDHVNEHSEILRNYRLHMWWNDTECNAAVGVKSFFDMMHSGPHKLMLFGAACTHVTDPIAKASKHWHLTQLSYADMHPMFTKDAFPNFFRVVPSENAFNAPRFALLKEFNWTRVGTIYQNEPRYSLPHNQMVAELDANNLDVVETQSFVTDVSEPLQKLREKDVRIILANFNEYWARKVFCEAYKLDMYGRSYQWLTMGTFGNEWWEINDTDCTVDQVKLAMESTIMTDLLPLSTSGDITISGITAEEYLNEYNSRRGSEYSRFHGYTYDGIWAVASAIQYVSKRKEQFYNLTTFSYRVKEWESIFVEALKNTSFEGVTGPVRFYNNERKARFLLKQFQGGTETKIGEYDSITERLDLGIGHPLKWVGRAPPKDRTLRIIEHSQVNITIFVILASISVAGIIMASTFLAINIRFRNQRYIKMSSPHLNNLIIVGCILTYLSVIFLGLDSGLSSVAAFPYICATRAWLLMAGFSLAFGAMFSKTWRVHSIFTDLKLNKKVIKDYQLFMVVGILLVLDLGIMLTWQIADPFYRETKHIEPYEHPTLEEVIIIQENEYCQSNRMTIFVGIIYAYKGLLLIFGAFLAWETRHVSIPALNDSKHIGMSVYNCVIMCVMGAAIALVLSDRKDAVFILISLFIIFCTTGTLFLVFIPKFVELKRNPSGQIDKKVRATLGPMSKKRRDSSVCELESRMRDVKSTNCRFRKVLMEKETELQQLIKKIGPEARAWLDALNAEQATKHNPERAHTTPLVKKDFASEATDFTSIGSMVSSNDTLDSVIDKKKKQPQIVAAQDEVPPAIPPKQSHIANAVQKLESKTLVVTTTPANNSIAEVKSVVKPPSPEKKLIPNDYRKESISATSFGDPRTIPPKMSNGSLQEYDDDKTNQNLTKFNTYANQNSGPATTHSTTELNSVCSHTREAPVEMNRRTSVQVTQSLKGNFVVSQSDLWDTQTLSHAKQHSRQSPRSAARCSDHHSHHAHDHEPVREQRENSPGPIQRSVSEKNRTKHRHKQKSTACQSETDSEREQRDYQKYPSSICSSQSPGGMICITPTKVTSNRKLTKSQHSHHHSTPNVAPEKKHYSSTSSTHNKHRMKKETSCSNKNLYGASSESELLDSDTAILPIFRKLLNEKDSRFRARNSVGASCPNISIKCDIVEYL